MLYNTGTLIVQSGTSNASTSDSFGSLKTQAARALGGENQSFILDLAGQGILKGIDVINMRHLFRFGSEQQADANLIADDATYTIPANTFAIQEVQLIDSNSKVARTLEYVPWGQFNSLVPEQTADGVPEFWTARNAFDDGEISVYPVPDADAAADYDIRITVYARIARPTLDSDVIDAPRELSECLVTYAEYYLHRTRNKNTPYIIEEAKRRFNEQLAQFVHSTEREPTETLQWALGYVRDSGQYDPLS